MCVGVCLWGFLWGVGHGESMGEEGLVGRGILGGERLPWGYLGGGIFVEVGTGGYWASSPCGAGGDVPVPPQQEEDIALLGPLQLFPPNGTIDLMYFPYYGKRVHVSGGTGGKGAGAWGVLDIWHRGCP